MPKVDIVALVNSEEIPDLPPFTEFLSRVSEMYLVHYPDASPTLDGAFREVVEDMIEEILLAEEKANGLPDCVST